MRVRVSDVKLEYCGSGVDAFVINGNLLKAQTLYVSIIKNMLFKQEKQTASILYTNAFIVYINNLRICANRKKAYVANNMCTDKVCWKGSYT